MRNTKPIYILKYTVYSVLFLLLYIVQTTPGLFLFFGVKPIWVVPAAIAIAMYDGDFVGGIYGSLAGLLCDMGGPSIFGFNGFVICVCCIMSGLCVIYLMRCNLLNCMLFVFVALLLRGSLEYLFAYGIWGYENVWKVFTRQTFPVILYSTAITPIAYFIVRTLHRKFQAVL